MPRVPARAYSSQALALQHLHSEHATQRNMSDTIWNSLRMAISMMDDSRALAELARTKQLVGLQQALGLA